ncbi:MAG: type II toxin-antitoxin system VapC family toxin [Chloroflexota bacterium]|nr:type II toxin-antitoxin system VapC family toxin [Chloroflexota bacterium]
MNVYLETSAVVKLIRPEPGSEEARQAAGPTNLRTSCVITYAEACSALARALDRRVRLDPRRARRELDAFWPDVHVFEVDEALAHSAADLALRHRLRGMDALHLAAALEAKTAGELWLASWDRELRDAARHEGIGLIPAAL